MQARLVGRLAGTGRKEAAMERRRTSESLTRPGMLLCCLLVAAIGAVAAGWAWLAVPAALGMLGVAATAVGVDSRTPGDWRSPEA
jgi:fatty acid desaturase